MEDPVEEGAIVEETTEWLIRQSLQAGDDEDEDIDEDLPILNVSPQPDTVQEAAGTAAAAAEEEDAPEHEAQPQQPQHLFAEEVEGVDASDTGNVPLSLTNEQEILAASATEERVESVSDGSEANSGEEEDGEVSSALAAAAAADSWSWGRIIRNPRKRNKHIIFDVCTATASMPAHQRQQLLEQSPASSQLSTDRAEGRRRQKKNQRQLERGGELVQQVITSAERRGWLGPAGYRMARKARWGDLWPTHYANRAMVARIRAHRED